MFLVDKDGKFVETSATFFVDADGKYAEIGSTFFVDADGKYAELVGGGNPLYISVVPYNASWPSSTDLKRTGIYYTEDDFSSVKHLSDFTVPSMATYQPRYETIHVVKDGVDYLVRAYRWSSSNNYSKYPTGIQYSTDWGRSWTVAKSSLNEYVTDWYYNTTLLYDGKSLYLMLVYESESSGNDIAEIWKSDDVINWATYTGSTPDISYGSNRYDTKPVLCADNIVYMRTSFGSENSNGGYAMYGYLMRQYLDEKKRSTLLSITSNVTYQGTDWDYGRVTPGPIIADDDGRLMVAYAARTAYKTITTYVNYWTDINTETTRIVNPFSNVTLDGLSLEYTAGCYADGVWIIAVKDESAVNRGHVIFYSTNLKNWTRAGVINTDRTNSSALYEIRNIQYIDGVLYAADSDRKIHISSDKGKTWTTISYFKDALSDISRSSDISFVELRK